MRLEATEQFIFTRIHCWRITTIPYEMMQITQYMNLGDLGVSQLEVICKQKPSEQVGQIREA